MKWILHYVKSSLDVCLIFDKSKTTTYDVTGLVNFDYSGDLDHRRFISGYIFTPCTGAISWKTSLQSITILSTTEAECIATTESVKECTWLRELITELGIS